MSRAHKLSPLQVTRASPGLHGDGAGLWLRVSASGARSWIFRYMVAGRARWMGLGPLPDVSLAEAREAASACRAKLRAGCDPLDERREIAAVKRAERVKSVTFAWCAKEYIDAHKPDWRNAKHIDQWRNTLATYAYPLIGAMAVDHIETAHILKVLNPIWGSKAETASRLRGRLENVIDWATAHEFRKGENPARWRGHLDKLLPANTKGKRRKHFAALPWLQMQPFVAALRQQPGVAARAVEFAILTAARSGEVRGATWDEIDLDAGSWTVPRERMKHGKEHRVPLCVDVIALLKRLKATACTDVIFPGRHDQPLSDMSLTAVLRRMERADITVHGFRSSFRDWAAESTAYPHEMAEMALSHTVSNKVEAAYRRGDLFEKRRRMMDDWAKHCAQPAPQGAIVPIRGDAVA